MDHVSFIRLAAFVMGFAVMAAAERAAPRRTRDFAPRRRWPSNLGVATLGGLAVRVLLPGAAVGVAILASARGWGLFNAAAVPRWVAMGLAVILLDLVIYLQHVMFHAVPVLWRVHRMHHADLDFDLTTGVRFHPVEIVLSMVIKMGATAALGPPAAAVVVFEVVLNATSMFNHANLRLPGSTDRFARWFIVTPDMHRVHHSIIRRETDSNFGFNLPWWDRLLGTYRAEPAAGHAAMTIGIEQFRDTSELRLDRMLTQPWRGPTGNYPINRTPA